MTANTGDMEKKTAIPDHLPDVREEMPDFEKMIREMVLGKPNHEYLDQRKPIIGSISEFQMWAGVRIAERIWKEHYEPLKEWSGKQNAFIDKLGQENATLREENERLKLLCGRFNDT